MILETTPPDMDFCMNKQFMYVNEILSPEQALQLLYQKELLLSIPLPN